MNLSEFQIFAGGILRIFAIVHFIPVRHSTVTGEAVVWLELIVLDGTLLAKLLHECLPEIDLSHTRDVLSRSSKRQVI